MRSSRPRAAPVRAAGRGRRGRDSIAETASPTRPPRRAGCRARCSKNATCSRSGHERTHPAQQMRRRIGDEARLVEPRGKDVAAAAAADQDLAPAVARPLEQPRFGAGRRGEDRRHAFPPRRRRSRRRAETRRPSLTGQEHGFDDPPVVHGVERLAPAGERRSQADDAVGARHPAIEQVDHALPHWIVAAERARRWMSPG